MYRVYILECEDSSLYTGITNNLERRLAQHASGKGGHYTSAKGATRIVYTEEHPSRSSALKREAEIKGWTRQKKLNLVELGRARSLRKITKNKLNIKKHRIYTMSFARVYPLYIAKVEKKGRTKEEVDKVIRWLTGYSQKKLEAHLTKQTDFETFFADAPKLNPSRRLITGLICGIRVEEIKEPLMREIRYLDKIVDELAKGRPLEKILRK